MTGGLLDKQTPARYNMSRIVKVAQIFKERIL